uniref:Vacuolar sorting protein Vps3844 C-terminal domain-containing protein n=1 Tax=Mycena chlorophos TaxID=658473 RepID=A0ABQ0M2F8_MYCCL|nr:predicted protein [Mycena chlorophos]
MPLPVDLLHEITTPSAWPNLRLVSRKFRNVVDPTFFSILFLSGNRLHLRESVEFIRVVGRGRTGWSTHATVLVVLQSAPATGPLKTSNSQKLTLEELEAVPALLAAAIRSCPRLRSFRFSGFTDPSWLYQTICDCVNEFPSPNYLDVWHNNDTPLLPQLSGLTTLRISTRVHLTSYQLRHRLALTVKPIWPRLQQPVPLQNVPLVQQVKSIVAQCPRLRVLHLAGGDSWDGVWALLVSRGIPLVSLTTDRVTEALLEYLKSYSGLERLVINGDWRTASGDGGLAGEFFDEVLPLHAPTLEVFRCVWAWRCDWCLGPNNASKIAEMSHLIDLDMSVNEEEVYTHDADKDVFHLALHTISRLPNLQCLTLFAALAADADAEYLEFETTTRVWDRRNKKKAALDAYLPRLQNLTLVENRGDIWNEGDWLDVSLHARRGRLYSYYVPADSLRVVWAVHVVRTLKFWGLVLPVLPIALAIDVYLSPPPLLPHLPFDFSPDEVTAVLSHHLGLESFDVLRGENAALEEMFQAQGAMGLVGEQKERGVLLLTMDEVDAQQIRLPGSLRHVMSLESPATPTLDSIISSYLHRATHVYTSILATYPSTDTSESLQSTYSAQLSSLSEFLSQTPAAFAAEELTALRKLRNTFGASSPEYAAAVGDTRALLQSAVLNDVKVALLTFSSSASSTPVKRQVQPSQAPFPSPRPAPQQPISSIGTCFATVDACTNTTSSCSGHGECVSATKAGRTCFVCACGKTSTTVGDKVSTQSWVGERCERKDVSGPFVLLAGTTLGLILVVGMSVGLLYSVGTIELPGCWLTSAPILRTWPMTLLPPPYPDQSPLTLPAYAPTPRPDERVLQRAARLVAPRTGTFLRSDRDDGARLTVMLAGQKEDNMDRPAFGRGSTISGTVFVAAQEGIVSVTLKLAGVLEALSVSLGYHAVKVLDESLFLFSRTPTTVCPNALQFSYRVPVVFKQNADRFSLPPSCDIAFPDGGFVKCIYSLEVIATYRAAPFLVKERSVQIELDYRQRTRPSRPRIHDPSLFATIKTCPEEWLQTPVELTTGTGDGRRAADLRCDLFVPSVGVFALAESIPFHVQLAGPLDALRELLLMNGAGTGNNTIVRQPIRVSLLRQVVLSSPEKGATKVNTVLCEAALGSLPAPYPLVKANWGLGEDHAALNWDGMLHLQNASVPSFDAGSVKVSYLISVQLVPSKTSQSTINRAHFGIPVKLTTDTWAGSAENPD